ncbi:glutamine--fructose-6-phosphate transaminase (isomerizing) [Chitinibacter sp. S2-10]|uniref:glutamine--fructose-6-phosphate transaminase (isomerizing) n=1 Tax=Chitinibacter sp. S2-10 TaxID=3373597 RepID=UPI003977B122
MNILLGAIASHDANPLLNHAASLLDAPRYFCGLAYRRQDENIDIFHGSHLPERQAPHDAILTSFNLYPHSTSPILYRDTIAISVLGHLENRRQLASRLESLGYTLQLNSDSEIIAALIDWHERVHRNLRQAVQLTLQECQGHLAFAVLKRDQNHLICATLGIPIFIGQQPQACFFSTDAKLIREQAPLLIVLESHELAEIHPQYVQCFNIEGYPCQKEPTPAHLAGQFAHQMLADIAAQPILLAELIKHYQDKQLASFLEQIGQSHPYQRILIIASGSSHHAAATARHWLEHIAGIPTQVEYASEFRYRNPPVEPHTLLIAISQSGETADTIAALQHAIHLGHQETLCISNQIESSISRLCKHHIMQYAGREMAATSTRTFTTQLLCLYFLALKLAEGRKRNLPRLSEELDLLPAATAHILNQLTQQLQQWAQALAGVEDLFVIGRNIHYPIALEAAQKMKEVSYLHAEGYAGGEIRHGPVTLINRTVPVIACLPWDLMAEKMLANLQEVRARQGEIYILSDVSLSTLKGLHSIQMPPQLANLNPVLYILAFQLLSYFIALRRGNDVDAPRNLSKTLDKE